MCAKKEDITNDQEFYNELKRIQRRVEVTLIGVVAVGIFITIVCAIVSCYDPAIGIIKVVCGVF